MKSICKIFLFIFYLLNLVVAQTVDTDVSESEALLPPTANINSGLLSTDSFQDQLPLFLQDFPESFKIQKDPTDPSRLLNVFLPPNFHQFNQFIAKVTDISPEVDFPVRDVNRTFLASPTDSSVINIHGLNAGHKYSIAVLGRVEDESQLIKEESVVMDPLPLNFDSNESIQATHHNITMHATKPERALQDTFRVEYVQLEPPRRFPILDVHDIQDQKHVELYLGNLSPGRDYDVTVTSLRGDLPSRPWKGVITTKPLRPSNLAVNELNSTCVSLSWTLPAESGADRFKIAYGILHGDSSMTKMEVPYSQHQTNLCRDILPGQTFIFAVITEKSHQISDPATISYTVRPLPPMDLQLTADFEKEKFRLNVELPSKKASKIDKCHVAILSEQLEKIEQTVTAFEERNRLKCVAYMDLIPGRRYEISASTISSQATSTKMFRSLALEPGFDMKAFGLVLQEDQGVIRLEWPTIDTSVLKIHQIWSKIVGNDSLLHVKLEPISTGNATSLISNSWKETARQVETSPSANRPVYIDHLRRGACYKIYMYTVTSSGIVSTKRFEEFFRLSAPVVDLRVTKISKNTAVVQIAVPSSSDRLHQVSSYFNDCNLNVVVLDMHSMIVYDKTIVMIDSSVPPILLEGLRPFHKYTINSQIICGQASEQPTCPPKMRTMNQLTFETRQDKPGPVQNLTVKALNPYSVQISWMPPALPNGIITHYIIAVTPLDLSEKAWTLNVGANMDAKLEDHFVEAVVDNLVGGQIYQMAVQAVTEAGPGDIPAQSEYVKIEMPIMAPPRPSSRVEILPNTVRSMDLTIRYNTVMFSTKHGLLTKAAIIVAQVSQDGKTNENWLYDRPNRTATWGQVQRFDIWPPYVAVETPIEPLKHFSPKSVSEVIGIDATCSEQDPDSVCNGPLKAAAGYRFKLRLYTAPNLWTDTLYSDVVVTEPLQVGATFRSVFLALFLLLIGGALALIFLVLYNRKKNKKVPPCFGSNGLNPNTTQSSKESQWNALKMIMAERAADCLAKLGLDSTSPPSSATTLNSVTVSCSVSANEDGIHITSPQNGLATTNCFNAHHRRSRSLRERTGVDQRLERLPSGPPPSQQKSVPWTVIKGANIEKSRPVRIADFSEHVRLMSADSDFRFSEEYEDLRLVGHGQPCIAADLTVNRAKNRFTNILPYDHSRVKLVPTDDEDGSDYINANYVPGFNSRREFIAAQGPLPSTRDHFWRVVWEQQCPAIVALTKCIEKGRDKCHQYWPDNNQRSLCFGDIEVTLLNESIEYDDFTIRELRLTNLAETGPQAARTVTHFHYMAWPDFGVPDHPVGIVHFVRLFRAKIPGSLITQAQTNKPSGPRAIVHCSAGVGRSGTFISVVRGLENIEASRPIDIFGSVYEMRLERCHMVQNEQQYIFIHQCLVYALENVYPQLLNPTAISFFNGGQPNSYSHLVNGSDSMWISSAGAGALAASGTAPRIEVHQNPAFIEDDEGIAESGL